MLSQRIPDIRNGPWANLEPFDPNDSCGDMAGGTEVIKTLRRPAHRCTIACTDTNQDGTVDVSVCAGLARRNGGPAGDLPAPSPMPSPATSTRCSCARVEMLPEPGAALALACGAALLRAR